MSALSKGNFKGINAFVAQGQVHAIMGPNGHGKSTLAYTLMDIHVNTVTEAK
jgi:Fe-S cluster assembly ATP-binding protein